MIATTDARRGFFLDLARLPGGDDEPVTLPPGVAGKRIKPWLEKRALLARTLRGVVAFHDAHLPAMADLWVASWQKAMPSIDFEARRGWLCDHLAEGLAAGVVLRVAIVETGDIAGFVMIDPATAYLDQIVVHPDQWGAGVAEALLRAAERLSPERIVLDVNSDNPRAVAFYEKQGFVRIAEGVNPRSGLATLKLEWRPAAAEPGGPARPASVPTP